MIEKKALAPAEKRELVKYVKEAHGMSIRQGCAAFKISSSVYYYQPKEQDDGEISQVLDDLSELHPGWGFWKMYRTLRRGGHEWNHKRVHRVYVSKGMNIGRKRKKRLPARVKETHAVSLGAEYLLEHGFYA